MNFGDIFKKSFLQSISTGDISYKTVILTIGITCVFAAYVFFVYRFLSRKTFYDKSFNISLSAISVIVAAIVITIQSSLVVSLGMVGALSIVRYRTAVKSPMDLVFLFWAIAIGIICGAGLPGIAIIASVVLTIGIYVLDLVPVAKAPMILVINSDKKESKDRIIDLLHEITSTYQIKSQTMEQNRLSMIVEVRVKDGNRLIDAIGSVEGITRCSLLDHDGEVTF